MGLGYNIDNDGGALPPESDGYDKIRAVSQVRFGVLMTSETNSSITFGGSIRGDNAIGGDGGGWQRPDRGDVFVSPGAWGTLTMGDTSTGPTSRMSATWNEVGLTCLGCENGRPSSRTAAACGNDQLNFADNPFAHGRPLYDYEFQNVGVSLSTNRDLTDVGPGEAGPAPSAGPRSRWAEATTASTPSSISRGPSRFRSRPASNGRRSRDRRRIWRLQCQRRSTRRPRAPERFRLLDARCRVGRGFGPRSELLL